MKNTLFRVAGLLLILGAVGLGATGKAAAQPTGNPKGTAAPPSSDAQKAPAARTPTGGFGESGKIITDESTAKARTQTSKPPASIGGGKATRDGEPGKSGSGAAAGGADPSAKPAPQ
jgi:hypothetical protein